MVKYDSGIAWQLFDGYGDVTSNARFERVLGDAPFRAGRMKAATA